MEIPGGMGGHQRPPGTENPGGWRGANQNVFRGGGYGYFLEPHILGVQKILDTKWNLQNVRVITTSISENNKPA